MPLPKPLPQYYWKHEAVLGQTKTPFALFGLQSARWRVYSFFNEYKGKIGNAFEYLYDRPDFLMASGNRVHFIETTKIEKMPDGSWRQYSENNQGLRLKFMGKFEEKTHAEWAAILNMSEDQVKAVRPISIQSRLGSSNGSGGSSKLR